MDSNYANASVSNGWLVIEEVKQKTNIIALLDAMTPHGQKACASPWGEW